MKTAGFYILIMLLIGNLLSIVSLAQPAKKESAIADAAGSPIVATVDGYPITKAAADRLLIQTFPNYESARQPFEIQQAAIAKLIDRRVVFLYLSANAGAPGKNEVQLELENLKAELSKIEQTIEQFLVTQNITRVELEFEIRWQIAWDRCLKNTLSDEFLEQHFRQHQRVFDDSEMRVAHLLFKVVASDSVEDIESAAAAIRQSILSNKLDWEQAVLKHSTAPTRESAGEIGWIRYHEPMPPDFSEAAFKLSVGEISPPIVTPFGVHLIKCLELRSGKTGWRDARVTLQDHAAKTLFEKLANDHRSQIEINLID